MLLSQDNINDGPFWVVSLCYQTFTLSFPNYEQMAILWTSRRRSLRWDLASALWIRLQKMRVIGSLSFPQSFYWLSLGNWGKAEILATFRLEVTCIPMLLLFFFNVHFLSASNFEFPRGKAGILLAFFFLRIVVLF